MSGTRFDVLWLVPAVFVRLLRGGAERPTVTCCSCGPKRGGRCYGGFVARREQMVVAFATVVVDANGARALVLRRGCETLVAMPLGCTNVEHCGSIVRLSLIGSSVAPAFLHLEDAQRRDAFSALVA